MQILYAIAIAGVLGVIARYTIPGRHSYGAALAPAVSAAAGAAAWGVLAWFGWDWSVGWIWIISIGAGLVAGVLLAVIAPPARERADAEFFERARRLA